MTPPSPAAARNVDDETPLTLAEVQAYLRVSRSTVKRLLAARAFPGAYRVSPGKAKSPWQIPRQSLRAFEAVRVAEGGQPTPVDDGRARRPTRRTP